VATNNRASSERFLATQTIADDCGNHICHEDPTVSLSAGAACVFDHLGKAFPISISK